MGFNSTVVILNDHLHEIEKDPEFGRKVSLMIAGHNHKELQEIRYRQGAYANGVEVLGVHHADGVYLFAVGGNTGRDLGWITNWSQLDNDEKLLRELADRLGYSIRKKPQRKGV
jgi:hypothetical protein